MLLGADEPRSAVELRGQVYPVAVADVEHITASGPCAELHVAGRHCLFRATMESLEERLDPERFRRIERWAIARLDRMESLRRLAGPDGEVTLRAAERLRVSRTRREPLERRPGPLPWLRDVG